MTCYICNNFADYSCLCSFPNELICCKHLKIHKADNSKNHTINILNDTYEKYICERPNENFSGESLVIAGNDADLQSL